MPAPFARRFPGITSVRHFAAYQKIASGNRPYVRGRLLLEYLARRQAAHAASKADPSRAAAGGSGTSSSRSTVPCACTPF
jgi:hypothetical protein